VTGDPSPVTKNGPSGDTPGRPTLLEVIDPG
jgi:hypothetical protein